MSYVKIVSWLITLCLLGIAVPAWAADCGSCGEPCSSECAVCTDPCCDDCFYVPCGPEDWMVVAFTDSDITGTEQIADQYGFYPERWHTSGRLHFGDECLTPDRFEIRFSDLHEDGGRGWIRAAIWPLSLDADGLYYSGYHLGTDPANPDWVQRDFRQWDIDLRFHKGEASDMLLSYEGTEFVRPAAARKPSYSGETLTYQWNFDLADGDIKGQYRQIARSYNAQGVFISQGQLDTSQLKLNARLDDRWSAYGKVKYTAYDFADYQDDEFSGQDYTVGLRYVPDCFWEIDASYRAKSNPTDNTVTSRVDELDEYGVSVSYVPGNGSWYEGGYRHRNIDYLQLDSQAPGVRNILRGGAGVTPLDVASATSLLNPEFDDLWFGFKHDFDSTWSLNSRFDYSTGDDVGTHVVLNNSPGLHYNEKLTSRSGLTYNYDCRNMFEMNLMLEESSGTDRGHDFDMSYLEGAWIHNCGNDSWLTLGYRDTTTGIETPFVVEGDYATDDSTYLAVFNKQLACFDYSLSATYTDATGAEDFTQAAAGVDLRLKKLGPWNVRLDWFDREYGNYPTLDTEAIEVGVEYRFSF